METYKEAISKLRTEIIKVMGIRAIPIITDFKKNPFAVRHILITKKNYYCGFAELQLKASKFDAWPDIFMPKKLLDGGLKLVKHFGTVDGKREPAFVWFVKFDDCVGYAPFRQANPAWGVKSLSSQKVGPYEAYIIPIGEFRVMEEKKPEQVHTADAKVS